MKEVILFRDRAVTQQGRMTTDRCSLTGDRLGHMKTQEHPVPNPALPSLLHLRGFWEDSDVDPQFLPLDLNQDRDFPPRPHPAA